MILHGYIRSTADMDVWVNKTTENYLCLKKALQKFGAPVMPETEFLGNEFDVWGLGKEPNKIEIMSDVKGIEFEHAYKQSKIYKEDNLSIRYIHLNHLILSKKLQEDLKIKMI